MSHPLRKLAELGWAGTACCFFHRLKLHAIRLHFGFDRWHADAPCCCRPYKREVVSRMLAHRVTGVVEIGCGLGDVGQLMRAAGVSYIGLDQEDAVIRAGRFIHPGLKLQVGSFERLSDIAKGMDTLLLLNWPHGLSPQSLVGLLKQVPASIRYIVIDLIRPDAPDLGFKFRHTLNGLNDLGLNASVLDVFEKVDHIRDLAILKNGC